MLILTCSLLITRIFKF